MRLGISFVSKAQTEADVATATRCSNVFRARRYRGVKSPLKIMQIGEILSPKAALLLQTCTSIDRSSFG
jgi:hypothetical protein